MLPSQLQCPVGVGQFEHLVCDLQPFSCREFALFNLQEKFTQKGANTGQ
jgi:hypothetical protein